MNYSITATAARKQFFKLLQDIQCPGSSVTISLAGEPKVVMMSLEDFAAWQETLEIIGDKELMKGIKDGLRDLSEGKVYSDSEIRKMLKNPK